VVVVEVVVPTLVQEGLLAEVQGALAEAVLLQEAPLDHQLLGK
jgi:hypothetical protein